MIIAKRSPVTGITHEMDLPVTEEQFNMWRAGMLIQKAFPNLTSGQREFIKTGITEEEWDLLFLE